MTKHDEIRQILHEGGFKFKDGRTALDMTDEEVEKFIVHFISVMAELGRQMANVVGEMVVAFNRVVEPYRADMERALLQEDPTLVQRMQTESQKHER